MENFSDLLFEISQNIKNKHQEGYMRTRINCYIEDGKIHNSYILMHNLIMGKKDGLEIIYFLSFKEIELYSLIIGLLLIYKELNKTISLNSLIKLKLLDSILIIILS